MLHHLGADPLSAFWRASGSQPFIWGQGDCLMRLADWVAARRGVDPAATLRLRYRDAAGAARLVRQAGGMAGLIDRTLAPLGISRTEDPQRGDIALVPVAEETDETRLFDGLTGAIVLKGSTVSFSASGALVRSFASAPIVAAWAVSK